MLRVLEQLRASVTRPNDSSEDGGGGIRDFGMANNLTFLASDLYPGKKIVVWAHNSTSATTTPPPRRGSRRWGSGYASGSGTSSTPSVFTWIAVRRRRTTAWSTRSIPVRSILWNG